MKPRLLDTFCGSGGCSEGYRRAGFAPYGIDNDPKPLRHYPFPYLCMDALEAMDRLLKGEGLTFSNGETLYLVDLAAFHASPPCQFATRATKQWRKEGRIYPQLISQTRKVLKLIGKPWVIENVSDAWRLMDNPTILCGSMFNLRTYRHRLFETSFAMPMILDYGHGLKQDSMAGPKEKRKQPMLVVVGHCGYAGEAKLRLKAMEIDWMSQDELSQSIPPAYTEYIGKYLMQAVLGRNSR